MNAPVVIAAIDLGPLTPRVLYHAAGFARLLGAALKIVHVDADASPAAHERVLNACQQLGPYQIDFNDCEIVIKPGRVSEIIAREAHRHQARLIVVGSRSRGGLTKLLLGSTSDALLRNATAPILLVPPTDIDIVSIDDHVALTSGPVIAAIDLSEDCPDQLRVASTIAAAGGQPLLLLTVAKSRVTDRAAAQMLRERGHQLDPKRPSAVIVRRGSVVAEIARCAVVEGAGLVVMGLRALKRGRPGDLASAVLHTGRTFVLAVPGC